MKRRVRKFLIIACLLPVCGICGIEAALFWYLSDSAVFNTRAIWTEVTTMSDSTLAGKQGWLFWRYSLVSMTRPWPRVNAEKIARFSDRLRDRGIHLIVIAAPNKEEVYPEKLFGVRPRTVSKQRQRLQEALRKRGVDVLDPLPFFRAGKGYLYNYDETHWNQEGILLLSRLIAGRLSAEGYRPASPVPVHCKDTVVVRAGDLYRFRHGDTGGVPETIHQALIDTAGSGGRRTPADIVTIGDSFLRKDREFQADISAHLGALLHCAVRCISSLRANANGPAIFRRSDPALLAQTRFVVWILTSRAFVDRFADTSLP